MRTKTIIYSLWVKQLSSRCQTIHDLHYSPQLISSGTNILYEKLILPRVERIRVTCDLWVTLRRNLENINLSEIFQSLIFGVKSMYGDYVLPDVILKVGNQTFPVHKARSSYLCFLMRQCCSGLMCL